MKDKPESCVKPAGGPIPPPGQAQDQPTPTAQLEEKPIMTAQVGKPAPNFEASVYFEGGFKNIKLSDYLGKWVVLCFYPGDFPFV